MKNPYHLEEEEYLKERSLILAEKEAEEALLWQEWEEELKQRIPAKIIIEQENEEETINIQGNNSLLQG